MGFTTKLDYSNNRQIKQHIETLTALSGGTTFGTSFANLTKGANTSTSGITEDLSGGVSTFSGNNTTTIFNWFDSRMSLGEPSLSAVTNDIDSQDVLPIFQPISSIVIDGNVINTSFTGITFNIVPMDFIDLGSGNYSGSVGSTYCNILSASTAEFTGRTIWVDVSGITRTERLIVTNNPQVGYVLTCNDTEGMSTWAPSSGGPTGPDVFVTGGTYSLGTATFTNNTGGTFNVTGFSSGSGGTSYWSAGTGTNAIATINGNNIASGDYSVAEGFQTIASGDYSHAEGHGSIASGQTSHAEGHYSQANGNYSHAGGYSTQANGPLSYADGDYSVANGTRSHAGGYHSNSTGDTSFTYGYYSVAGGWVSHALGYYTKALGNFSFAQGQNTIASGYVSFAGGSNTIANGINSFVYGSASTVNGDNSIVLGKNITGNTADTTYVDNLNIKTVGTGPGTIDLGVNASGVVVNQASDIRLKENINTIENPLDKVMNLRGVTYNWIDRVNGGDDLRLGFIAQEVQEVLPELITNNGDYLGVQYKDVPALLVEAIKELVSGNTKYSKTYLETQTILAEDNNIELNYNGTIETSVGGGIKIIRGEEESTNLSLDENGNWISNVNIFSKGFVIPEYSPTSTQDNSGIIGNIVQDDDYIYIKTKGGWKRTLKLEEF